jgi:hypothetical protein
MVLQKSEHTDILSGTFTLAFLFYLKTAMKDVETLRQMQIVQGQRMMQCTGLSFQERKVMYGREKDPFLVPGTPVLGNRLFLTAQQHPIHVSLYCDEMVSATHRHRIVVGIETYERQGVCDGSPYTAGIEGDRRKGLKRCLIFSQEF